MPLVLFIDMDYFFAACEELRHPELKGKPFVVGSAPLKNKDRGVVETCNYETRKLGVHSALPYSQALKLVPGLVYLESDDRYYMEMSEKVMKTLKEYGFRTEVISIDEAALDIGALARSFRICKRTSVEDWQYCRSHSVPQPTRKYCGS